MFRRAEPVANRELRGAAVFVPVEIDIGAGRRVENTNDIDVAVAIKIVGRNSGNRPSFPSRMIWGVNVAFPIFSAQAIVPIR
jgi:hypothetical protein